MLENAGFRASQHDSVTIEPLTARVSPLIALVVILGGNIILWTAVIAGAVWLFR